MRTTNSTEVKKTALSLLDLGFSVIPANADKTPTGPWKEYQSTLMSASEVSRLFSNGRRLAIVAGAVSDNLECLDIDDPSLFKTFLETLEDHSPGLPAKLCQRKTPNGYHILYRCKELVAGNQKLAMSTDNKVRIETRGEGGYFLHSPSVGYKVIKNSLKDCPVLSADEVRAIHLVAGMFDERGNQEEQPRKKKHGGGIRPGDEFNQQHSGGDLLENYGWKPARKTTAGMGYTRPGKKDGVSGVLLNTGNFYAWSTNAHSLEAGQSYSPFALYTLLEHGGDYEASAKDLAGKGYGSARTEQQGQGKWQYWNLGPPISLDHHILPDFSADILPSRLAEIVVALEKATETPIELPALLAIATVATACQKKFIVQPELGYFEPLNIWMLVALDPANRKSSVQKLLTKPLLSWERKKLQDIEEKIQEAESRKRNQEARINVLRSKYAKAKTVDLGEIESELLELEKNIIETPKATQIWAQDITPEKLGATMADQGEKLSILSAEGGIFDILGGRYSNGIPNLDIFLQSHSGDSVRVDRGSRAAVFMQHPALTMGLSPQPGVLTGLTEKPSFRSRGLLARFLYALPVSLLGKRTLKPVPLSPFIEEIFNQLICTLLNIEVGKDDNGDPEPYILHLSKQAWEEWKEFSLWVEAELADGGKFEHIRDWAGKLPGQAARIAGLFHCVENACGQPWALDINENTMGKALSLAAVLTEHALAVFDLMGADKEIDAARKVWRWIERNGEAEFTKRDCFRALSGTFKKVDKLVPAISILTERNYIRELQQEKGKSGRPSERFEVNPLLLES